MFGYVQWALCTGSNKWQGLYKESCPSCVSGIYFVFVAYGLASTIVLNAHPNAFNLTSVIDLFIRTQLWWYSLNQRRLRYIKY